MFFYGIGTEFVKAKLTVEEVRFVSFVVDNFLESCTFNRVAINVYLWEHKNLDIIIQIRDNILIICECIQLNKELQKAIYNSSWCEPIGA